MDVAGEVFAVTPGFLEVQSPVASYVAAMFSFIVIVYVRE